jgi:hypothetical protein
LSFQPDLDAALPKVLPLMALMLPSIYMLKMIFAGVPAATPGDANRSSSL